MRNPYEEDEWYDDEDYDDYREPVCVQYNAWLCKAKNGHLFIEILEAWDYSRYPPGNSENWDYRDYTYKLKDYLKPEALPVFIEAGKQLEPGKSIDFDDFLPNEDEEEMDWNAQRAMDMFGPDGYDADGNPYAELQS